MSQPLLSLCMIVKNEQDMLPDLLASVDGLWDELIVADTGSTDGTVPLLTAAGATIVTHRWTDDFAAARNASLAPANGRWILFLDADERISPELKTQIRKVLRDETAGAATVVMRNELPGGHHRDAHLLRLFRRDPAIRFRHRIHEDVLADVENHLQRNGLALVGLSGVVHHLGYVRKRAIDRDKKQRDQDLLRRALADDPTDFYCWFKLLELARFWDDQQLWASVAAEVEPLLTGRLDAQQAQFLQRNRWSGELAALVSQGLFPDAGAALDWLDRWRDRIRVGAAWHMRRGLLWESLGRDSDAAAAFAACLGDKSVSGGHLHLRATLGQCRLAARANNLSQAVASATEAAAAGPTDREALLAAVTFTGLCHGQTQVNAFARRHYQDHRAAGAVLGEILLAAGHVEPAREILALAAPTDPPLAMGLLTCTLALDLDIALDVDLDQDTADAEFKRWIRILWESRRTNLMTRFAENCGDVAGIFPWLPEYLAGETARLK